MNKLKNLLKKLYKNEYLNIYLIIVLLFALFMSLPFFIGYINGDDTPFHYVNIEERSNSFMALFGKIIPYIKRLARVEEVEFVEGAADSKHCAYCTVAETKIIVPLEGLIDIQKKIERQNKKIQKFEAELNSLNGRLKNEKFVQSAPKEVVEQTRQRVDEIKAEIATIKELIDKLS